MKEERAVLTMAEVTASVEDESAEEGVLAKLGLYGGDVRLLGGRAEEETAAAETMLLWGMQQPTHSKPNAYVAQASLTLPLEVCGRSLSILQSPSCLAIFPRTFGHEASGIVESVGEGVTEFKEGDHVLTVFTGECMNCKQCKSNKSNVCSVLGLERRGLMHSDLKTRFSIKGKPVYPYCTVSSFSEYTVVHSGCAVKVDPLHLWRRY